VFGDRFMSKSVFVTVGSTRFPELIKAVLSTETIDILLKLGYMSLCLQYGTDEGIYLEHHHVAVSTMIINGFDYSPSIEREMEQADMIICHAGWSFLLVADFRVGVSP
jgi:beta-1,4-N-acetylglucosaminyltransferase